jgi:hypothetical protein
MLRFVFKSEAATKKRQAGWNWRDAVPERAWEFRKRVKEATVDDKNS